MSEAESRPGRPPPGETSRLTGREERETHDAMPCRQPACCLPSPSPIIMLVTWIYIFSSIMHVSFPSPTVRRKVVKAGEGHVTLFIFLLRPHMATGWYGHKNAYVRRLISKVTCLMARWGDVKNKNSPPPLFLLSMHQD